MATLICPGVAFRGGNMKIPFRAPRGAKPTAGAAEDQRRKARLLRGVCGSGRGTSGAIQGCVIAPHGQRSAERSRWAASSGGTAGGASWKRARPSAGRAPCGGHGLHPSSPMRSGVVIASSRARLSADEAPRWTPPHRRVALPIRPPAVALTDEAPRPSRWPCRAAGRPAVERRGSHTSAGRASRHARPACTPNSARRAGVGIAASGGRS